MAARGSTKPVRENITKWPFFKVDENRADQIKLPCRVVRTSSSPCDRQAYVRIFANLWPQGLLRPVLAPVGKEPFTGFLLIFPAFFASSGVLMPRILACIGAERPLRENPVTIWSRVCLLRTSADGMRDLFAKVLVNHTGGGSGEENCSRSGSSRCFDEPRRMFRW